MKPPSEIDHMVHSIICYIPFKFKNVLMFEPPDNFENKELFDWGYTDFYLCESKSRKKLELGNSVFQWSKNLNEHFAVELDIPHEDKYISFQYIKATWFSKEFVLRKNIFKVADSLSFGTRLKIIFVAYTEDAFLKVIANRTTPL